MSNYTTQMDAARKGIVTPEIEKVAKKEKECKRIEKNARKHERYSQKLTREYNIKYNANIQL